MRGPGGCRHDGAAGGGGSAAGRWAEGREGGAGEARGRGRNAPASPRESPGTEAAGFALGPARPGSAALGAETLAHPARPGPAPQAAEVPPREAPVRSGRAPPPPRPLQAGPGLGLTASAAGKDGAR